MSPYYPTIDEDLARAKEILARGSVHYAEQDQRPAVPGAIYGGDNYAAYKLLESFVEHIESRLPPREHDAFGTLVEKLVLEPLQGVTPLLPDERFGQDVAFVAFTIDKLRAQVKQLHGRNQVLQAGVEDAAKAVDEQQTEIERLRAEHATLHNNTEPSID